MSDSIFNTPDIEEELEELAESSDLRFFDTENKEPDAPRTPPRKVEPAIWEKLAEKLKNAEMRSDRAALVEIYMDVYNIKSKSSIYRGLRKVGYDSGRRGMGGCKAGRKPIEKLKKCAALIHKATSTKYGPTLSTKQAIRIGIRSGYWKEGQITVDMVNRYMREHCPRKLANAQPPPIPRKADHVNQVGQFDISVCAQFYLKKDKTVGTQDPRIYGNKNKRGKGPPLMRAVYVEVLTRSVYVEYFTGAESIKNLLPILWRAWMPKWDEQKYPLKGMPDILITDKGSGIRNEPCKNLFDNLGIEFRPHATGNPRAKGPVEQAMWVVERKIESLLHFDPATSVEELNQKIRPTLIELNGNDEHSRYNLSRSTAFSSWVRAEHLRLPPRELDHFTSLAYREEGRVINSKLEIRYHGQTYSFMVDKDNYSDPAVMALRGQKITVMHSPFDRDRVKIVTEDGQVYYPALVKKDRYGYPRHAISIKTPGLAPKFAKDPKQQNIEELADVGFTDPVQAFPSDDNLKNLRFMNRPAKEFEGTPIEEIMKIPRIEAKKRLQEILDRRLNKQESEWLNQTWGEVVSEEEIRAVAEKWNIGNGKDADSADASDDTQAIA